MKVILILADGMRPDSYERLPLAEEWKKRSLHTQRASTVMPSVTLPCHMSLFHSVSPCRHGTTTNTFAPQVRPIRGLCEVLKEAGKKCAFFYGWGQLRDLTRPASLAHSLLMKGSLYGWEKVDKALTEEAIRYLKEFETDFTFLYLGMPDNIGHDHGWMGEEYLDAVEKSWALAERMRKELGDEYAVIFTADHGGHMRTHGTDLPEDMTVPVFLRGNNIPAGEWETEVSILDLAPTVATLLDVEPDREWEGRSLI